MTISFPYSPDVESAMKVMYLSLRENDRRLYAAVEATKLGHGGINYIAQLLGCTPKTVWQGQLDLQQLQTQDPADIGPSTRVRKKGVVACRS